MTTYIINLISGPGSGKTTMAVLLFAELKMLGHTVEYVQEYAKKLVWMQDYERLNNQYLVSKKQADLFWSIDGKVQYIVTDACLLHGLYYNRHNPDNVSNVEKTEKLILERYNQFHNINIFLERGDFPYEPAGRIQSYQESITIDNYLKKMMNEMKIPYKQWASHRDNVSAIAQEILSK